MNTYNTAFDALNEHVIIKFFLKLKIRYTYIYDCAIIALIQYNL